MSMPDSTTTATTPQQHQQDRQRAAAVPLQSHFTRLAHGGPLITHLTDTNSIPILSTHPEPSCPGLSALSFAFVQAHDTASRMGLGKPLRVTLATTAGTAVVQTATVAAPAPVDEAASEYGVGAEGDMLVGTVVATADRLAEARMASWGVEEVARRFQKSAAADGP